MCLQKGDFLLARLAVAPSVAESLRDNDAVLLSKEDPNVSRLYVCTSLTSNDDSISTR